MTGDHLLVENQRSALVADGRVCCSCGLSGYLLDKYPGFCDCILNAKASPGIARARAGTTGGGPVSLPGKQEIFGHAGLRGGT